MTTITYFSTGMTDAPLRGRLREALSRYVETPVVRFLASLGISPGFITLLGLLIAIVAACLAGVGLLLASGLVFLGSGLLDFLDGGLARYRGRVSPAGALLDSVTDRLSEGALFVGLGIHVALRDAGAAESVVMVALLMLTLLFSQMVSYVRARGEGLGVSCKVGLLTRPERVVLLSLGLVLEGVGLAPALLVTVGIVGLLSLYTVVQRFLHVRRLLAGR